jgi:hypothetical protein
MVEDTSKNSDFAKIRELSLDEIDATSDAGLTSWLKSIFGDNDPQPAHGPFNTPADHLR